MIIPEAAGSNQVHVDAYFADGIYLGRLGV